MACTIFYKGEIKKDCGDAFFQLVPLHFKNAACDIRVHDDAISVEFLSGASEPLYFSFAGGMLNGFCKWSGTDDQEFYKIFDFFIAARPLFTTLDITDDEGAFYEYETRNNPCKVKFTNPSTMQEAALKQAFASTNFNECICLCSTIRRRPGFPSCRRCIRGWMEDTHSPFRLCTTPYHSSI